MADKHSMRISFRKVPKDPNMFEFTIATPLLRAQFRLPRGIVNNLRVDLERALTNKPNPPQSKGDV